MEALNTKKNSPELTGDHRLAELAVVLADKKAENLVVLTTGPDCSFTDYLMIAEGQSSRQVKAMAEALGEAHRPIGQEGLAVGEWVLMDYGDIVVHLFHAEVRQRYALEELWSNSSCYEYSEGAFQKRAPYPEPKG